MTVALVLHRADGAAVSTEFRRAAFGKDDPFALQREIAWEGPSAMAAGRSGFVGDVELASFPHIETIVVVEGELTLTAAGAVHRYHTVLQFEQLAGSPSSMVASTFVPPVSDSVPEITSPFINMSFAGPSSVAFED